MEKSMGMVTGRYKIFGDGLQAYGDVMYSHIRQDNGLAGAPFTISNAGNGLVEARQSLFNPFGNNLNSVRYRLQQELRNRRSLFDKDYWRYVAGINGDFNFTDNDWISRFGYDSGYVYEKLNYERIDSGDARRSYIRALIAPTAAQGYVGNPLFPIPGSPNQGTFDPFIGISAPVSGTAPIYNNTNSAGAEFQTGVPIGTMAYNNQLAALDWTNGGASYVAHSFFYERDWLADVKFNAHLF